MKLIQVNIWGGKLKFQLMSFLHEQQADIVCMQEVMEYDGTGGAFLGMLNEITKGTDYKHIVFAPTCSFSYMGQDVDFGNAIISKFPIQSQEVIFTRGKYLRNYDILKDDVNMRNLQIVTLKVNGKVLHVLNHHGHLVKGSKDGNSETDRQMKIIAGEIKKLSGSVIFAGDLNLAPTAPSLKHINSLLENLPVKHSLKSTYSQLNANDVVCDYIFVNKGVSVKSFCASDELVSDHKALIVEFGL